ncbi:MAG: 5-oxoprolinase/urea amidolyase family protein [Verrucomicrobiales bacterium]|nr:5-oxoprolinase/urea amidolyase family protein [Verrucomicrobiales bacterium]
MLKKVLIANRGEIACRIIRTLKRLGIKSVAIYSEADRDSLHVSDAEEAYCVGPAAVAESYLQQETILRVAKETQADGIHPGYGLLSESPTFAQACEDVGIRFIGPTPEQMQAFALKHQARALAEETGVPLLPGTGVLQNLDQAQEAAKEIGYPIILKSSGGGGGIGMAVCQDDAELFANYEMVSRLARSNFGNEEIFLEKFVSESRHVEVQALGDGKGNVWVFGERDCSLQRRNQKVIEETPAPGLTAAIRDALAAAATTLLKRVCYRSAGTVEFLYDAQGEAFYFLEVNTRLQVEHGVTEAVTGTDLVELMLRVAADESVSPEVAVSGHSMEARVYAENPNKDFQPSTGLLTNVSFPDGVRVDSWISSGIEITPHYDPMLAKVIVHAPTRLEAAKTLHQTLKASRIDGITTNLPYLADIAASEAFGAGSVSTKFLKDFRHVSRTVEVLAPGTLTTIHDHPGRVGYWEIGIPPSGPMDSRSFELANMIVGNPKEAAGLEMTMNGPALRFHSDSVIALTGADMGATLNEKPIGRWTAISVKADDIIKLGGILGEGARAYLAIRHGIDVPPYLGSRSTFTLGAFGGHGGRPLRAGDVLHQDQVKATEAAIAQLETNLIPSFTKSWEIGVLYGPHGAPEFFKESYIETFIRTDWKVHFNSARTGVRLIGPKPEWARADGGEAGLHPSNIHDNPYAIGAIDFTGDMPVILGPDGPSLGGFVCPFTIVEDELWKMGQLNAGDTISFRLVTKTLESPIVASDEEMVYRRSGDRNVLIEFGPPKLDIALRLKVHQIYEHLKEADLPSVLDITPGVRTLQVHFDRSESVESMTAKVREMVKTLRRVEDYEIRSRIVHLPLSWDDPSTREAIEKYHATVRKDAPWYPSNIEFIRRINGLETIDEVYRTVFDASYVVLGLGDVYLGAPVATPLDPRHRLVTTKYNPARTWTPENAVGIGGAYLCIYGMEGPGGYQFVGRTVQMWNRYRSTEHFEPDKPWLLRFFDQVKFYPVSTEELSEIRQDFVRGRYQLKVEETKFNLADYQRYLTENASSIEAFRAHQHLSFNEERQRWNDAEETLEDAMAPEVVSEAPAGTVTVESPIAGNMWKLCVTEGQTVLLGEPIAILESMKMEMTVASSAEGVVVRLVAEPGNTIHPGQAIAYLKTS